MATRTKYAATITHDHGKPNERTETVVKYAWNSAIRATEELVRRHAVETGEWYEGDSATVSNPERDEYVKPNSPGAVYTRVWTGMDSNQSVEATVRAIG